MDPILQFNTLPKELQKFSRAPDEACTECGKRLWVFAEKYTDTQFQWTCGECGHGNIVVVVKTAMAKSMVIIP